MKNITNPIQGGGRKTSSFLLAAIVAVFAVPAFAAGAVDIYWQGGEGGSEAAPFDVYQAGGWDRNVLPSQSYHLNFTATTPTYLTNSYASATSARIADGLRFNSGEFVVLGPFRFYSFYKLLDAPYTASIVKKGDWWIDYFFRGAEAANSTTFITNEYGNVTVSQQSDSVFANGSGAAIEVVSKTGDWTFSGKNKVFFANGANSTSTVDKVAGDWTISNPVNIASGTDSTATILNRSGLFTINGAVNVANGTRSKATVRNSSGRFAVNSTINFGVGSSADGEFILDGGALAVSKTFYMGWSADSQARFILNDGVVTAGEYGFIIGYATTGTGHAYFEVNGGAVTNTAGHLNINEGTGGQTGELRVKGGDVCANAGWLMVGSKGAGTLTIDGGHVSATASGVRFCHLSSCSAGMDCFLNLNGGSLDAKTVVYGSGSADATFTFNGGVLKALAAGTLVAGHDKLSVKVASGGGTVDANAQDITIAEPLLEDSSSTGGGMTFKGGGTVTLASGNTYTGATTIEVGTTLSVASPGEILGALAVAAPATELAPGKYIVLTTAGADAFPSTILDGVVAPQDCELALADGGKTVVCVYKGAEMPAGIWLGTKNNDLCDGDNWSGGIVPNGAAATIAVAADATLVCSGSFSPDSITFPADSALVTISGPGAISGVSSIVNNTTLHHVFNCQVTCPDGVTPDITRTEAAYMTFAGGITMHDAPKTGGDAFDFWSGNISVSTEDAQLYDSVDINGKNCAKIVPGSKLSFNNGCLDRMLINPGATVTVERLVYTGCARHSVANKQSGWFSLVFDNGNGVLRTGEIEARIDAVLFHSFADSDTVGGTIIADKLTCAQHKAPSGNFPYAIFMLNCGGLNGGALKSDAWNGEGVWVIGPGGLSFAESVDASTHYELKLGKNLGGRPGATLHSFADWTLHSNPNGSGAIFISKNNGGFLVIDTSHYTIGEPEYDSATSHDVTLTGIVTGDGALRVVGSGRVIFNSVSELSGELTVSNAATVAVNAGCTTGSGAVLVTSGATLSLPESGVVTIPGTVTLQDDAVLSFNFTNGAEAPKFAFTGGATVPDGTAKVKVSAAAGVQPRRLDGKWLIAEGVSGTFALDEETKPTWADGVSVDGGNLYLDVKVPGLTLSVR